MTKRLQSKHKIERRYGVALWGKDDSPVHSRNYPPGQHGFKGRRKSTDYGQQLAAKQKLKGYYGNIGENQFRNIYKEARRRRGDVGEKLIQLLESRLDILVYRLKWVPTVFAARQMVNHKHVSVNGKRVNISSCRLKEGDTLELCDSMRHNAVTIASLETKDRQIPNYLEIGDSAFLAKFARIPDADEVPYPITMNVSAVIECYAR